MTVIDAILMITCGLAFIRWPLSAPPVLVAVMLAGVASVLLEGWRAPLLPAYIVGLGLLIAAALPIERLPQWAQWLGVAFALALLAVSIAACIILPPRRFPPTTGTYAVGSVAIPGELIERFTAKLTKPRPAPQALIWYPAVLPPQSWIAARFLPRNRNPAVEGAALASAPAHFPVVLYFAGWPGTAIQNYVLIRELASRGFVVVSLIYPAKLPSMSDAEFARHVADFNSPWDFSTTAGIERMTHFFQDRVRHGSEDAKAMLDLLDDVNQQGDLPQFRGRLALEDAGVMGFSMGGSTAAQAGWLEPRFKAVVNLDGWHWHEAAQQGVPRHYLYMSEGLSRPDPANLTSANLDTRSAAERQLFEYTIVPRNLERNGGIEVTVSGTTHLNFTDMNLRSPLRRFRGGGSIDRFRALEIVNAYVSSFFERELLGETRPLLDGASLLYPDAKVKVWPMPRAVPATDASENSVPPR